MTARLAVIGVLLAALLGLEQHVIDLAAAAQRGSYTVVSTSFIHTLPYPFVFSHFTSSRTYAVLVAIALVQSALFYALYRMYRERRIETRDWIVAGVCACVMLAISLGAHSLLSSDVYAYVGYAKIGGIANAYTPPPSHAFHGPFSLLNTLFIIWGPRTVPSYYGPLWVILGELITYGIHSVAHAVFAFRLLEVVPFAAIAVVLALRRSGPLPALLWLLNPAIYMLFIVNAHNDLLGIAFIMIAILFVEVRPGLSVVFVILAALVKLPLVAYALVVFSGTSALNKRWKWAAATIVGAVIVSLLMAGPAYFHDLIGHTSIGGHVLDKFPNVGAPEGPHSRAFEFFRRFIERSLMGASLLALAAVFLAGIVVRSAPMVFIKLMPVVARPWYTSWGLPYAARDDAALTAFLVILPFFSMLIEIAFPATGLGHATMACVLLAIIIELTMRIRAWRSAYA